MEYAGRIVEVSQQKLRTLLEELSELVEPPESSPATSGALTRYYLIAPFEGTVNSGTWQRHNASPPERCCTWWRDHHELEVSADIRERDWQALTLREESPLLVRVPAVEAGNSRPMWTMWGGPCRQKRRPCPSSPYFPIPTTCCAGNVCVGGVAAGKDRRSPGDSSSACSRTKGEEIRVRRRRAEHVPSRGCDHRRRNRELGGDYPRIEGVAAGRGSRGLPPQIGAVARTRRRSNAHRADSAVAGEPFSGAGVDGPPGAGRRVGRCSFRSTPCPT